LNEKGLKPASITALAVALGPGSFTGIRVGIATAEGIAMPQRLPVYGISTLDGLAENLRAAGILGEALCLIDAQRGECFVGHYQIKEIGFKELEPATIWSIQKIADHLQKDTWVAGPGALKYETDLQKMNVGNGRWVAENLHQPSAFSLAGIAHKQWKAGARPKLETLTPIYLRLPAVYEKKT
jgi:tRNA threonylcarbamoyladenosine biosynthesis protein TsaB